MYDLFRQPPKRFRGAFHFPELPYLKRSMQGLIKDVQSYYRRYPKRVDADNRLGNLLIHIPRRWDLDDHRYVRFVEDASQGVSRAMGFTSSSYRGRVHENGIILGKKTDEVVITTLASFDVNNAKRDWINWAPYQYLYHTRADVTLPVLNNTTPGKGHGVATLNIPMLALQYRYWLKRQHDIHGDEKESVYRFIGGIVLPNVLTSYIDIAIFNRWSRQSRGIGTPKYPMAHPFYLTDFSQRIDALGAKVLETQAHRGGDIEQAVYTTPMIVHERLWDVMALPKDPVSRANEWAFQLARLPYVSYVVRTTALEHQGDRRYLNELYTSLVDASNDSIFSGVGSSSIVRKYRESIRQLIVLLEERGHGWS